MDAAELNHNGASVIPFYAVTATGGKVYTVDDKATVNDFAALDGTGGSFFQPFFLSTLFPLPRSLGWVDLRKMRQRFDSDGPVTLTISPWRDGFPTGQSISRNFGVSGPDLTAT
ncbi:MAG TPA: hypothetical protein VJS20_04560, partial [Gemmatimonadales bacterium]|nr:hypothetical protein [Gemmatimonadales bacterium]